MFTFLKSGKNLLLSYCRKWYVYVIFFTIKPEENEKQTTALENPDQTSSIEKLKTAIKTMKLYDPEFQNSECIHI